MRAILIGSIVIFVLTYLGILHKKIPRTIASMGGAVGMILFGRALDFYETNEAISHIDFNTIGLLLGMMILVGLLGETGFFRYIAIKTAKASKGSYYRLLALFVLVTAFASAFLDNVTTILLIAPITITIANELEISPIPFLIAEVISSNIGGTATLIGDPPNIMIGSAANINFLQFLIYLAPIVLIVLFTVLLIFELRFHDMLKNDMENFEKICEMEETKAITNKPLIYKSLIVLLITIFLFTIHHILGLEPWVIAITGSTLLLLLTLPDPEMALTHVHWTTLLFFAGLFIVIGGLYEAGVIELIAFELKYLSGNSPVIALFIVLTVAGIFSMAVGNIPAAITLIPAVNIFIIETQFFNGFAINPIWWALALGTCFGGNGTLISAPSNLIIANISDKMGYPITFKEFTKTALPITVFSLLFSFILLWFFFVVIM